MAARFYLILCASALLVQSITANCGCGQRSGWNSAAAIGALAGAEIAAAEIAGANAGAANFGRLSYAAPTYTAPAAVYTGPAYAAKSGGAFGISVASPISPTGVSLMSENSIDGALEVAGSLPVLAGVAFEGTVPSAGSAGTAYSCGSGDVGIAYESLAANGVGIESAAPKKLASAGCASPRIARPSCGCY